MLDPGYSVTPDVLTAPECAELAAGLFAQAAERSRAGARHLMSVPAVAALANGAHLQALAAEWLGRTAVPFRATLFDKSAASNWLVPWHQDTALPLARRFETAGWGPWSEKSGVAYAHAPSWALGRIVALRVHLDDSGRK